MTQSVVEKTSIPEKTWKRQTDSPLGWITFACGSVILHLLAFWLISSYKLSASQSGSDLAVPIEFIEISPQKPSPPKPQPKPKAVSPKPIKQAVPQNSKPAVNKSVVEPPVSTNDRDAIAFDNQKIQRQLAEQQQQPQLLQQQQLETQQLQREAEQLRRRQAQQQQLEAQLQQQEIEQQRQLAQRLRQQEIEQQRQLEAQRQQEAEQQRQLEAQRQQEAEQQRQLKAQLQQEAQQRQLEAQQQLETQRQQEAEQRQLAQQSKLEAEEQRQLATQQQPQNNADGEKIADAPTDALGRTPQQREKAPQAPIPNQSNQNGGILTASWKIDTDTFFQDKPDNLAKPKKRSNSDIPLPPPQDGNFQPGDFLVWLTIDNQGNLLFVKVDPAIPIALRSQYQEYAEKIFNGQKFIPASSNNGEKPDLSNLPIRVNIQER